VPHRNDDRHKERHYDNRDDRCHDNRPESSRAGNFVDAD
jgi:hypothetical protein